MIAEPLPNFDAPPVAETALSVQFARIPGFSTPMAGWFWKAFLPLLSSEKNWEKAIEVFRLEDVYERFGDKEQWVFPRFRMSQNPEGNRVQILQAGDERMVQVQDSRFVLNWKKGDGQYPSYEVLSKEFWSIYAAFEKFLATAGLAAAEQNQWEVTYVNRIFKGEMWSTTADWIRILPKLSFPAASSTVAATADPISLDWRYDMPNERGRLYVSLQHARSTADVASEDFMQLTLVARGAVDRQKGWDLKSGFDLGHEAIVRTFAAATSPATHKLWKRTS